jgi:hypothetical protein
VEGNVELKGTLNLANVNSAGPITVLSANGTINGMFEEISFTNSSIDGCDNLIATQEIVGNSVSIVIEPNCGLPTWAIVVLVVGIVVVIVTVGVIAAIYIRRKFNKEREVIEGRLEQLRDAKKGM